MTDYAERHFRCLVLAIWLVTSLFLVFMGRDAIGSMKLGDPDDALRIVQVRDWLSGQSWWDITQYRMNWPDGGPMHWSRLVDVPIAAAILLFRPILGQGGAEQAAAAIVPLLTYGVVLAFYAAAARRLWGPLPAIVASLSFFLILPAIVQVLPMRIDHHGWQLALFCIGLWALFDPRQSIASAAILGLAMALWIEISVEGLPFAVILLGILALRWFFPTWRNRVPSGDGTNGGGPLLAGTAALAAGLFIAFSSTEYWSSATQFCDGLSPFHLAATAAVAAVLAAAMGAMQARIVPATLPVKLAACGSAATAGALAVLALAPQCAGDAFATLDPLVRTYWFDRGAEGLPLWVLPPQFLAQPLAGLAAGLAACLWLWRGRNPMALPGKIGLTLLFIGCALVGSLVSRTIVYALLIGNLLLAPMAVSLFSRSEHRPAIFARIGLKLVAVALLLSTLIGPNILAFTHRNSDRQSAAQIARQQALWKAARWCQSPAAAQLLNRLPAANILAPLDSSPSILLFTPHRVVATGHHRNAAAMADVIRTFTGSAKQAAAVVQKRQIDYVLTCDGSFELRHYAERNPRGFMAQIGKGQVPDWLVRQGDIGPFHMFKIDRTRL